MRSRRELAFMGLASLPRRFPRLSESVALRRLFYAIVLVVLGLFVSVACRSLPKLELARRLSALEKNVPISGLQRLSMQCDLGRGQQEFELVYHHVAPSSTGLRDGRELPIVLVHGTPSTLFGWSELIHRVSSSGEGLGAERDIYALEVIGHGVAPGDAAPYSFERCARFVSAALRALQLERVHLVGQSYGGEFAWRAVLNEPERVASLVLIDSSGIRRRDGDWLPEEVLMRESSFAKLGWLLNSRDRVRSALAPHFGTVPPGRVEEFFSVCENAHNWKAMVDLARDENGDRESELNRLELPTLLLWGAEDIAYPPDYYGRRFAELIPNATWIELPETGHYPHEERPVEVVAELTRFFESVEHKQQ